MAPGRTFGHSWWGRAWLESLETSEFADERRLARGRTYARQDRVQDVSVIPGGVNSTVWGKENYSTSLSVRQLDDAQWDTLIDLIVSRARYAAELLSGAMPQGLAAEAAAAGAPLLPTVGDLVPDCSCPDWGEPCKHAAALCYMTCDLIDDDPFLLFFVRGRDRASIVDEVRRRRAELAGTGSPNGSDGLGGSKGPSGSAKTVDPAKAFARTLRALPAARPIPAEPGPANPLRVSAPADSGLDNRQLERLANDAAERALGLLVGQSGSGLRLPERVDIARRAARRLERGLSIDVLVPLFPGAAQQLEAAAAAWSAGGSGAVIATIDSWPATAEQLAPAKAVLGRKARKSANAMHAGSVQLRLDLQGRWWRFERDDGSDWVFSAGPFDSAASARAD